MFEIRAIDAINLDEEDSTEMFLNGKVVNKLLDKEGERKVNNKILVSPRKNH